MRSVLDVLSRKNNISEKAVYNEELNQWFIDNQANIYRMYDNVEHINTTYMYLTTHLTNGIPIAQQFDKAYKYLKKCFQAVNQRYDKTISYADIEEARQSSEVFPQDTAEN